MLRHFTNMHRSCLIVFEMICGASFLFGPTAAVATGLTNGQFLARDHLIIDLRSGVEWMRCSVGQQWNGTSCDGEIIRLNHDDVAKAIVIANEQLGGNWRLPNREELEGLVCAACETIKIDSDSFPQTVPEPYWTGEVNGFAARHFWSVNFMTGYTYGRFFPQQELAVRLVRDR
jgi:hypothetical protein